MWGTDPGRWQARSKRSVDAFPGLAFDAHPERYDRHRPVYPESLVERACQRAGLRADAPVLEIGCGTGQLTGSLLRRGLRVTAVEPGERLIARMPAALRSAGGVRIINRRLEDTALPQAHYRAAFAASAIHWVDPDVSWRRLADSLVDGGLLALISYFGLHDPWSEGDQRALRGLLEQIAPDVSREWPAYRPLDALIAGVSKRRTNVARAWAWLGDYRIARAYAESLFEPVEILTVPRRFEHTAGQINGLLGTMSFWPRLTPAQREDLSAEIHALHVRLGRPIRSSTVACLLSSRRRARAGEDGGCDAGSATRGREVGPRGQR